MLRHVFNGANAHGGQGKWNAEFFGGTRCQNFTVSVLHAGHAGGCDSDRHADVLADHGGGGAAAIHVDGDTLAEFDLLKIVFVGLVSALGIAA